MAAHGAQVGPQRNHPWQHPMMLGTSSWPGARTGAAGSWGVGGIGRSPGAQGQCPGADQKQGAAGANLFLDKLQGQAGGPVGVRLPEQSPGAPKKGIGIQVAQGCSAAIPPGWEQGWPRPVGWGEPQL